MALEAIREIKTLNDLALQFDVHPSMIILWKKELLGQASSVFEGRHGLKPDPATSEDRLYGKIGRLKKELDWLHTPRAPRGGINLTARDARLLP